MSARTYSIRMPGGELEELTSAEIARRSGININLVRRRLTKFERSWAQLTEKPEVARARAKASFLRGTESIFAEVAEKRAAEAAREERTRKGNADI